MKQDKKTDDIPFLKKQMNDYKKERDHILELCLNLQTKLDAMKHLEVDLRHEIYQLKQNQMMDRCKKEDVNGALDPLNKKWDQLFSNQVTIKNMLKDNLQTNEEKRFERYMERYLIDQNNLLEEIRDILKNNHSPVQETHLPTDFMTNGQENMMMHLLNVIQRPIIMNNFIFNSVREENSVNKRRKYVEKEFMIDMSEKKDYEVQNIDKQEDERTERIIQSQEKEISALKKELDDMKSLLEEKEVSPSEQPPQALSKRRAKDRFTFRDIQNAKNIYSIPTHQSQESHIKKKFGDYFQKSQQRLNVNPDHNDDSFNMNTIGPHAKIVGGTNNKDHLVSKAKLIDHMRNKTSKQRHMNIDQQTKQNGTKKDTENLMGYRKKENDGPMVEHANVNLTKQQKDRAHHMSEPQTKETFVNKKKEELIIKNKPKDEKNVVNSAKDHVKVEDQSKIIHEKMDEHHGTDTQLSREKSLNDRQDKRVEKLVTHGKEHVEKNKLDESIEIEWENLNKDDVTTIEDSDINTSKEDNTSTGERKNSETTQEKKSFFRALWDKMK